MSDIIIGLLAISAVIVASILMIKIGVVAPFAFLGGTFVAILVLVTGILLDHQGRETGRSTPDN